MKITGMVFDAADSRHLSNWDRLSEIIDLSTPVDKAESGEAQAIRIRALEADPEKWFQYYFPRFAYAPAESFHREATRRLIDNPEWYEVRMWSRELAKSTRAMMEVFYLTLTRTEGRARKYNVLLVSNSEDNAIRLLIPYKINFEVNNRLINDYGIQVRSGSWERSEFKTRSGISFRAVGAGQSPRGSRNDEVRPDIILFDDIDTDEDCRNPEIIKKKWKWIEEAVMPTRSISKPTTVLFCGNRIATDCCVQRATVHADLTDEINIRDENGTSSWPSKNSEADIDRVLDKLSYAAIQKEYYNNPVNEGSVFKEMAYTAMKPLDEYSLLVCYTDPSYRESKKNDYKATVLVGRWKGQFHVIKAFVFQGTTAQMIDAHYQIMDVVGENNCYYYIEQVFLQDTFIKEFNKAGETGKSIPIRPDTRSKKDKFMRIESLLEPLNRNGQLYLNEAEKDHPGMKTLAQQFIAFAPGSSAHDDGPDAVEGAVWILNNRHPEKNEKDEKKVETVERTRNPKKAF